VNAHPIGGSMRLSSLPEPFRRELYALEAPALIPRYVAQFGRSRGEVTNVELGYGDPSGAPWIGVGRVVKRLNSSAVDVPGTTVRVIDVLDTLAGYLVAAQTPGDGDDLSALVGTVASHLSVSTVVVDGTPRRWTVMRYLDRSLAFHVDGNAAVYVHVLGVDLGEIRLRSGESSPRP
jgi:hypothetical protein